MARKVPCCFFWEPLVSTTYLKDFSPSALALCRAPSHPTFNFFWGMFLRKWPPPLWPYSPMALWPYRPMAL